jgi:integrase
LNPPTLEKAWWTILKAAGVSHCRLHAIRHRAATDIANCGVPVHVGMALTGHKTAAVYSRYLHEERERTRAAAETVLEGRTEAIKRHNEKVVRLRQTG